METPNTNAGRETERVMAVLASKFNPDALLKNVDTRTYNQLYSIVLEHLTKQETDARLAAGMGKRRAI